jgi:hypothetical protein
MNSNRNAYPNADPKFDPQMMHQRQSNPSSNTAPPPYQHQQPQQSIILIFSNNFFIFIFAFIERVEKQQDCLVWSILNLLFCFSWLGIHSVKKIQLNYFIF